MDNHFESLSVVKNEIVHRLAYDENIAKCLLCNRPNFMDYELDEEEMDSLIGSQIYPYDATDDLQNEAKSYITMRFKYKKSKNSNVWKIGYVAFRIFCHKSIVRTDYGKLRYDYLLEQIDRLLGDTRGAGWLGQMQWVDAEDCVVDSDKQYVGIFAIYQHVEFK